MTRLAKVGVAAIAVTAAAIPVARAGNTQVKGAVDADRSLNMTLVHMGLTGGGGTDLEFFSRSLTTYKTDATTFVTSPTPVERHFSMVGNQTSGAKIIDITDPTKPFIAGTVKNCNVGQGDIQVNKEGTLGTIGYQSGTCKKASGANMAGTGSAILSLADPYNPAVIGFAPATGGSHNNTLDPSGRYLYISGSSLTPGGGGNTTIPIYDLKDPVNPKLVQNWTTPGNGPHDIRFSVDGKRAYLAGISTYKIVNTENLEAPVVISTIVPPGGSIGHDTLITPDKRFLFLGDEAGGGGTFPCPGGAVYAYDLTDERAPILLGLAEAGGGPVTNRMVDEAAAGGVAGGCTSHVMELNPDKKSFTLGWYTLGSRIFSFASFYNADGSPKTAAGIAAAWGKYGVGLVETNYFHPDGGNTWSAKQYAKVPGYVFSDDLNKGFYVTKITG